MLAVFNKNGEACNGNWEFAGLRVGAGFVTAVIRNTNGTPKQEYAYSEASILSQIDKLKQQQPTMEAANQLTVLNAGLLAVRRYKFEHGIKTYRYK